MPQKKIPWSLKTRALQTVSMNFEMLCYGSKYAKGTKALAHYIHTEGYKDIEGPFADWPSSMLQDVIEALYRSATQFGILNYIYYKLFTNLA